MNSEWLVPPTLARWQKEILVQMRRRFHYPNTLWVLSSGTQSVNQIKCVGLSRDAVEASAVAVNQHLQADRRDHWLVAIPSYHMGGYSIPIRAQIAGAKFSTFTGRW